MPPLLDHKMWMKQLLKGFAERVPETMYQELAEILFRQLPEKIRTRITKVENLNEAYRLGHDLAALLFGGVDEPS